MARVLIIIIAAAKKAVGVPYSKTLNYFGCAALAASLLVNCGGDGDEGDSSGGSAGTGGSNSSGAATGSGGDSTGSGGDSTGSGGDSTGSGGDSTGSGGDSTGSGGANGGGGEPASGGTSGSGSGVCGLPTPVGSCDDRENALPSCVEYYQGDPSTAQFVCEQVETRTWTTGQGCSLEGLAGVCTFADPPFQSNFYYEEDPGRAQGCEDNDGTWCEP
jgi:hypothetical protein